MDALFDPIVALTGATASQLKLITCLLVSYPLGNIYVRLPPYWKHHFSLLVSMFYLLPVLGLYIGLVELLVDILLTYYVASIWRGSKRMPWVLFGFLMLHLTITHIRRTFAGIQYETVEISGPQMVLTMKLTTFAFNVLDGQRPIEELDKWQQAKRITTYPSLVEFLGYSFYYPGFLVGPYLDFAQYMDLVHEGTLRDASAKVQSPRNIPPGRKRAAYVRMLVGLAFLGLFVVLGGAHHLNAALEPEFVEHGMLYRVVIYQVWGFVERSKYYAVWTLTEGASIVTGLGFSGISPITGQPLWNGAANVDIFNIEFTPNIKVFLDSWNKNTNVWLRECVYKRVTPKGKKPGFRSSMLTFGCSALWHGVAPGYYLCFITGGLVSTLARLMRRHVRPLLLPHPSLPTQTKKIRTILKFIYDISGTICTVACVNYCVGAFMALSWHRTFVMWARLGFYGHVVTVGGLVFFYAGGTHGFRELDARRGKRKEKEKRLLQSAGGQFQIPPPLDEVIPPPE